jgi:hypothetical protein
MSNHLGTPIIG